MIHLQNVKKKIGVIHFVHRLNNRKHAIFVERIHSNGEFPDHLFYSRFYFGERQFLFGNVYQHEDEAAEHVDSFAAGREQVLRELGGQKFVDLDEKRMELDGRLAWRRACIKVAEKQAELDRLSN